MSNIKIPVSFPQGLSSVVAVPKKRGGRRPGGGRKHKPLGDLFDKSFQTRLSQAEVAVMLCYAQQSKPSDWVEKWSKEIDGLRGLIRVAATEIQRQPSIGENIKVPPGTAYGVFYLRADKALSDLIESVRLPAEKDYHLIKRLIQVGAKLLPLSSVKATARQKASQVIKVGKHD